MKRVIVLSWFKNLTNRFFGEEYEEKDSNVKKDHEVVQEKAEEHRSSSPDKPNFRFPIITDAEIYGWDEPENEQIVPIIKDENAASSFQVDDEDDFEPIPLFENERWPGNHGRRKRELPLKRDFVQPRKQRQPSTIHRTKTLKEVEQDPVVTHLKKRFTPTSVPSPVFGFSPAEKKSIIHTGRPVEEQVVQNQDELQQNTVQMMQPKHIEQVVEPQEIISDERDDITEEVIIHTEVEDLASSIEMRDEHFIDTEKAHSLMEPQEIYVEEQTQLFEPAGQEVLEIEEDSVSMMDSETTENGNDEVIERTEKKESTIPFNVLMLKSDKEKLARLQQISPVTTQQQASDDVQNKREMKPVKQRPTTQERQGAIEQALVSTELETEELLQSYAFPPFEFLVEPELKIEDTEWLEAQSDKLEESLSHFGIEANVLEAVQGPTVTRFELTVGQGTKVSRIRNLTDDLKLALAAKEIRMQAPIPGTSSIGIEIPNRQTRPVRISEVIGSDVFAQSTSPMEAVLGLDLTGKPVTLDLRKMPHGLIAGATGSGKSVCINSVLISLLYKSSPDEVKMMLIDPKMVELAPFNGIPHLISPVITDVKAANAALKWVVAEMERRYELLAHSGVRDIERFNKLAVDNNQKSLKMPYLLVVIDELADLMMTAPADVETSIGRIAQKARAAGIHLIIATQRPSVDVITGIIKANVPTRIAFSVSSQIDSRTIIDGSGAERLLGKGDMLYLGNGQSAPVRLQGTFVTDDEIERIIDHVQREASPNYLFGQDDLLKNAIEEEADPLFEAVCQFIFEQSSASTSALQRQFSIGYNRAAKLMDRLEERGYISEQRGSRARDVLITETDLEQVSNSGLVGMQET